MRSEDGFPPCPCLPHIYAAAVLRALSTSTSTSFLALRSRPPVSVPLEIPLSSGHAQMSALAPALCASRRAHAVLFAQPPWRLARSPDRGSRSVALPHPCSLAPARSPACPSLLSRPAGSRCAYTPLDQVAGRADAAGHPAPSWRPL
ncbi:hypothetical protein FRC08_005164 [Ceratobasidium sp. 394]|nr:hypothetical protein FRC08_005164 [Ceratobasidium sp. 394]